MSKTEQKQQPRKPRLKIKLNKKSTWFAVNPKDVTFKETKNGNKYAIVKFFDFNIIFWNLNMVISKINDKEESEFFGKPYYSVGIVNNRDYPINETKTDVSGADLTDYIFDNKAYLEFEEKDEEETEKVEKEQVEEVEKVVKSKSKK